MSETNGALSVPHPRPRRIITASSKLVDPQNTAEPIPSHKHAIELKRAAESANKHLDDAASGSSGPLDSRPPGHQPPLSTLPPTVFPSSEPQTNANKSNSVRATTGRVDGDGEDGVDDSDEPIEHRK